MCRLGDARFATQNEHLSAVCPHSAEQTIQRFALTRASLELARGMESSHATLPNRRAVEYAAGSVP